MIKLIYFDIGGVVVLDGFKRAAPLFAEKLNIDEQTLFDAYIKTDIIEYPQGKIDGKTRWINFFDELDIKDVDIDEYIDLWHSAFQPIRATIRLISKLKTKHKIGCLSDQPLDMIPYLDNLGILDLFDPRILSCEINHSKEEPNYKIYEIAEEQAGLDSDEILFIDNTQKHLDKAKELGYNVLLFTDVDQLEKDLKELNLL